MKLSKFIPKHKGFIAMMTFVAVMALMVTGCTLKSNAIFVETVEASSNVTEKTLNLSGSFTKIANSTQFDVLFT